MARSDQGGPAPDDLPRSRSGRIPQWVLDEANGHPAEAHAFRSWVPTEPPSPRRRRTLLPVLVALALVAAVVLAATRLGAGPFAAASLQRRGGPPVGYEEHSARLLPAPQALASTGFRFMHLQQDGSPVTWSPCRPIHYVVRPDNAPPDGPALVAESFQRLSAATGLTFVDDGATEEPVTSLQDRRLYQPDRYGDRWAPVLVAWATPQEVPDFGVDVAGEAGPAGVYQADDKTLVYVSGTVYLDPVKIGRLDQAQGEPVARDIVLHELGHLAGLEHVADEWQVMWPRGNAHQFTEYQSGDLAGLARLGSGPCRPGV